MIALLIGAGLALLLALVGTPLFIRLLVHKSYGQFIRDDGPTSHHTKRGTPTMGGTVVVGARAAELRPDAPDHVAHEPPVARANRICAAPVVPDGGDGPGGLPRRLHQDFTAAQPGTERQGQADPPGGGRHHLRRDGALLPGRPTGSRRHPPRSRWSATSRGSTSRSAAPCSARSSLWCGQT